MLGAVSWDLLFFGERSSAVVEEYSGGRVQCWESTMVTIRARREGKTTHRAGSAAAARAVALAGAGVAFAVRHGQLRESYHA